MSAPLLAEPPIPQKFWRRLVGSPDDTLPPELRAAQTFFWRWLIGSTVTSIAANVAHALLAASEPNSSAIPLASGVLAVIPPVVQVVATHGVHVLVRARIIGWAYAIGILIAATLAGFAFVLSFEAIRELAIIYGGKSAGTAWIWPLVIDLSITGSTVSLLALTRKVRNETLHVHTGASEPFDAAPAADSVVIAGPWGVTAAQAAEAAPADWEPTETGPEAVSNGVTPESASIPMVDIGNSWSELSVHDHEPDHGLAEAKFPGGEEVGEEQYRDEVGSEDDVEDVDDVEEELRADAVRNAESIVHDGVVGIGLTQTARVLHDTYEGKRPGTTARDRGVGFRTVAKILHHHNDVGLVPRVPAELMPKLPV
ncbi:DUF2637 domain-containing protein [Mycolicibacterium fortuitum]|nr:DUF2637 domain-containing protein [Mycolicibacterium fortuitum]